MIAIVRFFRVASALFVLAAMVTPAWAVDPHRMISQYIRDSWKTETGFPGGDVAAIAQAADGYLWIGTDKGLIRFDGLEFRVFPRAEPQALPFGSVKQLLTDSSGNLWVLLGSTKIVRFHDRTFEFGRDQAEEGITAIGKEGNGTPLFSSLAFGTLTYADGKFRVLQSSSNSTPPSTTQAYDYLSSRHSWTTSVSSHHFAEPGYPVTSIAETSDGKIWLATEDKGLFYLTRNGVSVVPNPISSAKILCLLALDHGELWVGTEKGLFRWDGKRLTQDGIDPVLRRTQVRTMIRDRDSNIWIGASSGLIRVNDGGVSIDGDGPGHSGPVTALCEDREGNLWIGRPQSIERLRDSAFLTYSIGGDSSESSGPVYVDPGGRAWFALLKGGPLRWLKDDHSGSVTTDGLNEDVIYSIAGAKNDLWIGRQRGGLTHLLYDGQPVAAKTYTQSNGLPQNGVYAVYQSRDGSVWTASLSGGVSQYRDGQFTTYTAANGLASNTVAAIEEGPDGTMWFATPAGLSALKDGKWHTYRIHDGLPNDNINCLMTDPAGTLWIGTVSGLAYLRSGQIHTASRTPPSMHEAILGIAIDRSGVLWISSSNHVLSVKSSTLLDATPDQVDVHEYGLADGLKGTEGVKRFRSVVADAQGRIWFSMNRGLSVVDPSRAVRNSVPAIVQVESITADGNPIDPQGPLRIPGDSHRLTFSYAGLSLAEPERVQFKYKLDGFDEKWSEPASTRTAVYTNLPWGSYKFHVIASNSDGVWSDEGATLNFSIPPRWYQTTAFRLLSIAMVLLVAWAIYQLRLRQIAQGMSARFDERLAERTRIARELHDTLLQTIQGSKLVAEDALDPTTEPPRMRDAMLQLSSWLEQASQEGRAALNSLRTSATEKNDLSDAFRRAAEECCAPNSMTVTCSVIGYAEDLHPIVRDEVYRIGFEAIRNACTHSKASRLDVDLRYAHDLTVQVSDNGIGIDPAILSKGRKGHFGLQGMRERVARIGGKITFASSPESGTLITVVVPGGIIFKKPYVALLPKITAFFRQRSRAFLGRIRRLR